MKLYVHHGGRVKFDLRILNNVLSLYTITEHAFSLNFLICRLWKLKYQTGLRWLSFPGIKC